MAKSRREFLATGVLGVVGVVVGTAEGQTPQTPGAPVAFGTAAPVGPAVSSGTFTEAEKLVQVDMSAKDIAEAAGNWQQSMAAVYERRTGPRRVRIEEAISPATVWNPVLPHLMVGPAEDGFVRSSGAVPPLPAKDEDIAYAPV